jgi:hypothetical protein
MARKHPILGSHSVDDQLQQASRLKNPYANWIVLVPFQRMIEPETNRRLDILEDNGIQVFKMGGCSQIDWIRCLLASIGLKDEKEAIMFVDSDMVFHPNDVLKFFRRPEHVVAGIYAQKRYGKMNANFSRDTKELILGDQAPPEGYPVRHIATGFMRIKTSFLKHMISKLNLPMCTGTGQSVWPFFMPMILEEPSGVFTYLSEDYAFAERCHMLGMDIVADTSVRLDHLGTYAYGWEEMCGLQFERDSSIKITRIDDSADSQWKAQSLNGQVQHDQVLEVSQ